MRRLALAAIAVASLSGCGAPSEMKGLVRAMLTDPDSAKFGKFFHGQSGKFASLNVNAKNKMGGYAGESCFFFEKGQDGKWFHVTGLDRACDSNDVENLAKTFGG